VPGGHVLTPVIVQQNSVQLLLRQRLPGGQVLGVSTKAE